MDYPDTLTETYAAELAFLDQYCRGVDGRIEHVSPDKYLLIADVSHDESYGEAVQLCAHNSFEGTLTPTRDGEFWTVALFDRFADLIAIGANSTFEEAYENAVEAVNH
ncbi:hypothetical protein [Rhodococcoides fascians]|uniref:hypothetical protein n=1 Tax=Rhodococcoides fascians TaxID=1828 RepID=UPI00050C6A7B|nr:hypothetical protein [Rhodococcus fascians]